VFTQQALGRKKKKIDDCIFPAWDSCEGDISNAAGFGKTKSNISVKHDFLLSILKKKTQKLFVFLY